MSLYKFKEIQTIPPAKQLVDICLSKTNRKTPTIVHPGFKITRIRNFYMRKVKFCQTMYGEKFGKILEDFPKIDDIHPFYADLCNVLYDRDHYKLALGQVNATKKIVDVIAKDYVKMMKFADSLYKCKMLKRAALGRMATSVKKLAGSLSYLEEVRQHLGRLPSINPATRTLILTGYPNVGKSSFMNIVTNADVDVQPYAFTTKSLFIGHLDYNYVRWQVIDTPGILDHPLEDRNTIEMTAITALAHLPAAVLFFIDVSEMCGYPLPQQVALFHSIQPLFRNRPLLIILNKTDLRKISELSPEEKALLDSMKGASDAGVHFFETSCATKDGVDAARSKACDLLLEKRVEQKVKQGKADTLRNRLHIVGKAPPQTRPPCIPESIRKAKEDDEAMGDDEDAKEQLERDRMEELGGAGVYSVDMWKRAQLTDPSWKYDVVPEIMDGHNVYDFVDPDIDRKLAELEREEELLMKEAALRDDDEVLNEFSKTQGVLDELHSRIRQRRLENKLKLSRNGLPTLRKKKKKSEEVEKQLEAQGMDATKVRGRSASKKKTRASSLLGKRKREATAEGTPEAAGRTASAARAASARSASRLKGLPSEEMAQMIEKKRRKKMRHWEMQGKKGEADRHIPDLKPKHLYSGKRGIGKTDRR
mmetsp:Transcript_63363/g.182367  ORF Transcript_63363/g.182367 Transcript_63363/m.182367 type:complete len:648 (+) Transcript_63363:85-2028(+)